MTLVQVEIANIEWENDESSDIEHEIGADISFILELPDYELTSEEIDNAIRDAVESKTGHCPLNWELYEFDADILNDEDYDEESDF